MTHAPLSAVPAALALVVGLPAAAGLRADEAVLRDGRTVSGTLSLDARGRLHFTAGDGALPARQIERVNLHARGTPFRAPALHEVLFRSGEHLTGELLGLDDRTLRLRTAWRDELSVPRPALAGVRHFAGQAVFFVEDFEHDLSAWHLTGSPERAEQRQTSGGHGLRLDAPGQEASYALPEPVEAGRVEVNFLDPGPVAGVRWLLIAEFAGARKPVRVVLVDGSERYSVEAAPAAEETAPVVRTPGWHRLSLRFAPAYLLAGVDDAVVWSSADQGPGGPLRKVALRCEARSGGKASRGAVSFDDFSLARAADGPAHRTADKRQDDVWLLSGDQWFGRVTRADRRTVLLQARPGPQTFPWGDVRGVYFAPAGPPPRRPEGERVRVGIHPGRGNALDELEGVLVTLDERRLVLRHAELGELTLDRPRVGRLTPSH